MRSTKRAHVALAVTLGLAMAACGGEGEGTMPGSITPPTTQSTSLVDIARVASIFTALLGALQSAQSMRRRAATAFCGATVSEC